MAGIVAQDFIDAVLALAAQAARNPPVVVPVVIPFALLPGAANRNALDWGNRQDMAMFNSAIEPLDTKYGMQEEGMRTFLEQVRERARIYCWDDLLTVLDSLPTPVARNLITNFGMVSLENCQAHAAIHVNADTRMAQDNMMLYFFILGSLTESAKLLVITEKESYTVANKPSGVCLLKVIIGRSSIDTNAKVGMLRKKIAKLSEAMRNDHKGNVRDFNVYVAETRDQLTGRGQAVDELITHVFDAYKQVPDEEFQRYIETFQNKHDEGLVVDVEELMRKALTKYDTINQRKESANDNENKILALKAETSDTMQQKLLDAIQGLQANAATKKDGDGKKAWSKKPPVAEWKSEAPGEKDPKVKTVKVKNKEKVFHWCPKHALWCIHKPEECTLKVDDKNPHHNCGKKPTDDAKTTDPKLSMMKALMSILNQDIEE